MFKLDDNLLRELGLGALPPSEKNRMLSHIYETLEMRVGMKLAEQMTNEQLDEFEAFIDRNDEAGALKWLETNFPNYKQVVADELEKLKAEITQAAPQIMAASQQQAAQTPPAGAYPQPQPAQSSQYGPQPTQPQPVSMPPSPTDQSYGQQPPVPSYPEPAPLPPQPYNQNSTTAVPTPGQQDAPQDSSAQAYPASE